MCIYIGALVLNALIIIHAALLILNAIEATESQIDEATNHGQKRAPPSSTQTTPVKSLSLAKKTRQAGI
jgi:hypothetical protein